MSKRKITGDIEQLIEDRLNKRLKEFEVNQKTILTDKQIFQLFDECNLVMIKSILSNKKDFDINKLYRKSDRHKRGTLLYHACDKNNQVVIQLLLSNNATDVNKATTDNGTTPLLIACLNGHEEVVGLLLSNANIVVNQATTDDGTTPLFKACQHGYEGVVRLLLDHMAIDVNQARTDFGVTPLFMA